MMVYGHFPAASFYLSDHFENSLKKLHFFTKIDGRYESQGEIALKRNVLSSSEGCCIKIHLRTSSILSIPLCLSGSFTPSRTRQETLKIYSRLDNIEYRAIKFSADFCNLASLPACLPNPYLDVQKIRQIINEATKNSLYRTDRMARLLVVMHSRYPP